MASIMKPHKRAVAGSYARGQPKGTVHNCRQRELCTQGVGTWARKGRRARGRLRGAAHPGSRRELRTRAAAGVARAGIRGELFMWAAKWSCARGSSGKLRTRASPGRCARKWQHGDAHASCSGQPKGAAHVGRQKGRCKWAARSREPCMQAAKASCAHRRRQGAGNAGSRREPCTQMAARSCACGQPQGAALAGIKRKLHSQAAEGSCAHGQQHGAADASSSWKLRMRAAAGSCAHRQQQGVEQSAICRYSVRNRPRIRVLSKE